MSLINQVLKDLDKRGASSQIGASTVRVVHTRSNSSAFLLIAAGAAGMLGVGAAAWMMWGPLQRQPAPVVAAVPLPPVAVQAPVLAPVVAVVQKTVPMIEGVSPDPVRATGLAQLITIKGSNFSAGATVTLRNSKGVVFKNRPVEEQTGTQIVIKSSFRKAPAIWNVDVTNADGAMSEPYAFNVRAPVKADAPHHEPVQPLTPKNKRQADTPVTAAELPQGVNKQPTQISTQQQAENEFRRAYQLMRQGRNTEALAGYEAVLKLDPGHDMARQTMVSLLLEHRKNADAERVLQEGLQHNPQQSAFAMLLARLQVEHDSVPQALETLLKILPYAEKQADYQSFVAALLQRQARHEEAIEHYQKALQLKPQSGVWLMGMGISLQSLKRDAEARVAFQNALATHSLTKELQEYVERQLKEL